MSEWEWDIEIGTYYCDCGAKMVSLVLASKDGWRTLAEIPLICSEEGLRGVQKVLKVLGKYVRDKGKRLELLEKAAALGGWA